MLRFLDARGRPDGEVRELSRSRNAFGGELVGHASHRRMLMVTTPFDVVDFEIFGPDGTSVRRRVGGRSPGTLHLRCGGPRTEAGHGTLVASARRFVLGFSTFARGAEHFIRATALRVR